jgi:hypothetical protein
MVLMIDFRFNLLIAEAAAEAGEKVSAPKVKSSVKIPVCLCRVSLRYHRLG